MPNTKDYKTTEEIIVNVGEADAGDKSDQATARRGGIVRPGKRASDYLPRRLSPGGFINFYDLGQIKNLQTGVFADLPVLINPRPLRSNQNPDTPAAFDNRMRSINQADISARDALVFAAPLPDWKTIYRRFEYADGAKYLIALRGGAAAGAETDFIYRLEQTEIVWTPNGLQLTGAEIAAARLEFVSFTTDPNAPNINTFFDFNFKTFQNFGLTLRRNRITNARDPNAPDVNFTASAKMDIFLMPNFFASVGNAQYELFPPGNNRIERYLLNYLYTIYPRAAFLNSNSPFYNQNFRNESDIERSFVNVPGASATAALLGVQFAKTLPGARAFYNPFGAGEAIFDASQTNFPPLETKPPPRAPDYLPGGFHTYFRVADTGALKQNSPFVVAVILQNGNWFYVWSNRVAA